MPKYLRFILTLGLILSQSLLSAPPAFAQDDNAPHVRITQVDNSNFPQVTVYLSVTNAAGEPIAVDPNSIQIFENGEPVQAGNVTAAGDIGPLTTLLVVDVSGSMEKSNKMEGAREAARTYVDQMRPGDRAGLIAFNTEARVVQPVTDDR